MAVAVCVNPDCEQRGVPKDMGDFVLKPDEVVTCGGWVGEGDERVPCLQPCEIHEAEPK